VPSRISTSLSSSGIYVGYLENDMAPLPEVFAEAVVTVPYTSAQAPGVTVRHAGEAEYIIVIHNPNVPY